MKISVDVDIEPSEVPAATELLKVLRSLTEHIRVSERGPGGAVPNGHAQPPQQVVRSPRDGGQGATAPSAPSSATSQNSEPAPDPERQHAFANYIRGATNDFGEVVRNLEKALGSGDATVEKLFYGAFGDVVLDHKYIHANEALHQEHLLYISLLGELEESIRMRISQGLIGVLVKNLMAWKQDRGLLLLPAMVYAHLVQLNMASIKGTIKMVERFLTNNQEIIGLTVLGKTAELCIDKVLQHASPAHLKSLTSTLDRLDASFEYDVNYLNGFIKWQDPCFRILTTRQPKHLAPISAMAFDPREKQLISASKDGTVNIWDEWGNIICRHNLQSSYAYALAVRPEHRDVILIAQPIPNSKGSNVSIAAIGVDAPHTLKGPYNRSRTAVVTALAILPGHEVFAVGEQLKDASNGAKDAICVYEGSMLTKPAGDAQPFTMLPSSTGQITCLSGYGKSQQVVVAGTRNGQVALWALKNAQGPVKIFDMPANAGVPITLDHDGQELFICGTSGKMLVMWDTRQMHGLGNTDPLPVNRTFGVDNYAVLKVLFWPNQAYGPQVAIMSVHGCWIADLSGPADQPPRTQHVQDVPGDDCSFIGAAWTGEYPYLYAGGGSTKVHVCQFVPDKPPTAPKAAQ